MLQLVMTKLKRVRSKSQQLNLRTWSIMPCALVLKCRWYRRALSKRVVAVSSLFKRSKIRKPPKIELTLFSALVSKCKHLGPAA